MFRESVLICTQDCRDPLPLHTSQLAHGLWVLQTFPVTDFSGGEEAMPTSSDHSGPGLRPEA